MFTLPHACKYPFIVLATFLTFFAAPHTSLARSNTTAASQQQQPATADEVERGVRLFQQGDFKGAIKTLKSAIKKKPRDEERAWLYLGHAQMSRGDLKEARKSFERLLAARPTNAGAHAGLAFLHLRKGDRWEAQREAARALELDRTNVDAHFVVGLVRLEEGAWLKVIEAADAMIRLDSRSSNAYYLKSQAALGLYNKSEALLSDDVRGAYAYNEETLREARLARTTRLREAAENLEKYIRLNPRAGDAQLQREQIETLRVYAESGAMPNDPNRVFKTTELTSKAVIFKKPDPGYTREARYNNVTGVVRLRAVLAADGQVKHILVVKSLPHGLTEMSVRAARGIKFKPATLNGAPVSQFVTLEYNFNIY